MPDGAGTSLTESIALAGIQAHFGDLQLPDSLAMPRHPLMIGVAGGMAVAELVAVAVPRAIGVVPAARRLFAGSPGAFLGRLFGRV